MKKHNVLLYVQINVKKNLSCTSLSFGHNVISFSTTAINLRFHFTDDMRIVAHVQDICRNVYIDIRHISSIRHLLSIDATKSLLSAFVLPKLGYCNYLFYVCLMYILERLQKVPNSASRLIFQCHKQNHPFSSICTGFTLMPT